MSKAEIKLLAAELGIGEQLRTECPFCKASSRTFSITRDGSGGLLYNCYRATCGARGFLPTSGELLPPPKKTTKLNPYTGSILPLTTKDVEYFWYRFGLTIHTVQLYIRRTERDEYLLDVLSPYKYIRGHVVRQPVWRGDPEPPISGRQGYPKARLFMHTESPAQAWYGEPRAAGRVILVEDQLSAMKVAQAGYASVALLGTQLSNDKVMEIAHTQPDEVIIALDDDATETAFKLARKWSLAFRKLRVVILERDLKEHSEEDIVEILT